MYFFVHFVITDYQSLSAKLLLQILTAIELLGYVLFGICYGIRGPTIFIISDDADLSASAHRADSLGCNFPVLSEQLIEVDKPGYPFCLCFWQNSYPAASGLTFS